MTCCLCSDSLLSDGVCQRCSLAVRLAFGAGADFYKAFCSGLFLWRSGAEREAFMKAFLSAAESPMRVSTQTSFL